MKTATKVTIGLSIAAIAGISTAVIVSDKLVNTIKHKKERCKVKKFVDDKFDGNEKLLSVVDELSNEDLDSLVGIMEKIKDSGKSVSVYGDNLKEATENLKQKLLSFIDDVL